MTAWSFMLGLFRRRADAPRLLHSSQHRPKQGKVIGETVADRYEQDR